MPGDGDASSKGFAMKLSAGAKKPKVAAAASAIGAADAPDAALAKMDGRLADALRIANLAKQPPTVSEPEGNLRECRDAYSLIDDE